MFIAPLLMFIFVVAIGYIIEHVQSQWKNAGIIVTIALVGSILLYVQLIVLSTN